MSTLETQDLRRDATTIVSEQVTREIVDVTREDLPEEGEINLIGDRTYSNRWEGFFEYDGNSERIYQVSYRFDNKQFYITDFAMLSCTKADSPFLN